MGRALGTLLAMVVLLAGLAEGAVTVARRSGTRRLRAEMVTELEKGGLQSLLLARVAGTRVALDESGDVELAGELAYVDALLSGDYGLRARPEAERALERARSARGAGADMARALLALADGKVREAEALAARAGEAHDEDPRPPLLLARARLAVGDVRAASQALEAAMVKGPRATAPVVAWAELRLAVGQTRAAALALDTAVARAPDHTRAWLLHEEAHQALGDITSDVPLVQGCRRDGAVSPVMAELCALRASGLARLRGDRALALTEARAAGVVGAVALAQLGRVDEAAARVGSDEQPALSARAWGQAAVALGRGELPALPPITPSSLELRLLFARAALASRGPAGLKRALGELGAAAVKRDPDLRALGLLVSPSNDVPPGPVRSYAEGLVARLAGDLDGAARAFSGALEGHGDTCRAAGEYVAALRLLHRPLDEGLLAPVRAANARCLNLDLPPPAPARLRDRRGSRPRRPGPRRSRSSKPCGRARRRARTSKRGSSRSP
jgi:tetratricopeptide (TPR) repeat protein